MYGITSELGELKTYSHTVESKGKTVYNSGKTFFESTSSRENFKSNRYEELSLEFSTDTSNRKAVERLNRIRLEEEGVGVTTFRNCVEREGIAIQKQIEEKCDEALLRNGFNNDGELQEGIDFQTNPTSYIEQPIIEDAAINLNIWDYDAEGYEHTNETVNVSIDAVCVNRQTEMRPRDKTVKQPERVDNTVIHVQYKDKSFILNASTLLGGFKMLIGVLLINGLLKKQIVIFADGARDIHNAVIKMFSFANYKIILDWFHLKKKLQEQLSMALKGSKIRNEFLNIIMPCLWFGNVDSVITKLQNIDEDKVKNNAIIIYLIGYLQRVRAYIPNYALRKELGLRNSSNLGEKANDIVVSNRQKHNGMSWSNDGSVSFATVAAASYNHNIKRWTYNREVSLMLQDAAA